MSSFERSKSSAVAAAVALACAAGSSSVTAVTIKSDLPTLTVSNQYVARAATTGTSALVTVTLAATIGTSHNAGDRIVIGITGASFPSEGAAVNIGTDTNCSTTKLPDGVYNGTSAIFRVASGQTIAANAVCDLRLTVPTTSLPTSSSVGMTWTAFYSGLSDILESQKTRSTMITTFNQFSGAVTQVFNGVVDVNTSRLRFEGDDGTASGATDIISTGNEDQFIVRATNGAASFNAGAAGVSSVTVNIVGDFSFLDDDGSNSCATADVTGNVGVAGARQAGGTAGVFSLAGSAGCSNATLSYVVTTNNAGDFTSGGITIAVGKNVANTAAAGTNSLGVVEKQIPVSPSSYTASVSFSYFNPDRGTMSTGSAPVVTDAAAGSFTLNGSSINVPFLPYGDGISRIVYLTNRSAQSGAVTATAIADDTNVSCGPFSVVTSAKANGVTLLTSGIDAGVRACYGSAFAGKVALTIVSNVPGATAEVFSGYNRNGSITSIVNSSNGK